MAAVWKVGAGCLSSVLDTRLLFGKREMKLGLFFEFLDYSMEKSHFSEGTDYLIRASLGPA